MRVWKKIVIVSGTFIIVSLLIVFILLSYLLKDLCGNKVYSICLSPTKEYKAVVFQRDCGATTGFSTQISIIAFKDELKNEKGNVYIIDGQPKDVAPDLTWLSATDLKINTTLNGAEYKAEETWGSWNKINIKYGVASNHEIE